MNRWIAILAGLLLVQLAAAVAVNMGEERYAAFQPEERLLAFDAGSIDGLRIEDSNGALLMRKENGRWSLPDSGGFPARGKGVEQLLEKLAGLKKGWPVATTAGAAERFKVADGEFERRIELLAGSDSAATLYVGSSPGLRKVHVRAGGEEKIYAVELNSWELTSRVDDWIDSAVTVLEPEKIERLEMPGFTLQRSGEELRLEELGEGERTDAKAVSGLLDKVAGLRIQSLLGSEPSSGYDEEKPALEFTVKRKDGGELRYRFWKPADEEYYVLKRSDMDHYLKVAKYLVEPILETGREKLLQKGEQRDEGEPGGEDTGGEQGDGGSGEGAADAPQPAEEGAGGKQQGQ
ncbi:MAG TPA: DUF4340 domain-containing protein [Gammaproteobacteria bacterium]|nr:DUF4340 domain-containing protein [Gammaproteobacteria bacterium]